MKIRTAYFVVVQPSNHQQYLLPTEIHLVKQWLKEGNDSVTITKHGLLEDHYKSVFGI